MLIVAADMHIRPGGAGAEEFWHFLEWVSRTSGDICFLGDVLELWIGLPGYDTSLQTRFIEWCRAEKKRRHILFVEGNHEFFVAQSLGSAFTSASREALLEEGGQLLLSHGDTSQSSNRTHLFLRRLLKSPLARILLQWLPGAHAVVTRIQKAFRRASMRRRHRGFLPQPELLQWVRTQIQRNPALKTILIGHFHRQMQTRISGTAFTILPAWKENGEVAIYSPETQKLCIGAWRSRRIQEMLAR